MESVCGRRHHDQQNKRQTTRNLITTSLLLSELHNRTENQINNIQANNKALSDIQHRLDSLSSDKIIDITPKDSIAKNNYLQRLIFLSKDLSETNKSLKNALDSIQTLEIKGNSFKYSLDSDIVKVDLLRKIENDSIFSRRVSSSMRKHPGKIVYGRAGLFLEQRIFGVSILCRQPHSHHRTPLSVHFWNQHFSYILKSKYKKANIYPEFKYPIAIFKHPLATATLITITLCQLFIPPPPFIFAAFKWVIASTALTIIICKTNTRQTLCMVGLFGIDSPDNSRQFNFDSNRGRNMGSHRHRGNHHHLWIVSNIQQQQGVQHPYPVDNRHYVGL